MAKYPKLEQLNQKLAKSQELSEHNKEILDIFFTKMISRGDSESYMRTQASRVSSIKELIDFPLDDPEKKDIERIFAEFNSDGLQKERAGKDGSKTYSIESKESFEAFLGKFYRTFIKKKGKGYNEDVDGPELLEDLKLNGSSSIDLDRDKIPSPEQVKKVAESSKNLTHKAMILFGWATGFRNCEWVDTDGYQALKWKHVELEHDKEMKVTCPDGKTGGRTIWIRTAKPIMEKLKEEQENTDENDPVFTQINADMRCPNCCGEAKKTNQATYRNRKYACKECNWKGGIENVERHHKPMTDDDLRNALKTCFKRADVDQNLYDTPHKFFRSARACFWAIEDKNEAFLRKYFGWSRLTNTPQHYISLTDNDLRKGIRESYGDETSKMWNTEALNPIVCSNCGTQNSPVMDHFCTECESEITYEGLIMKEDDPESEKNEIKHETKDEIIAYLQERSEVEDSEIEEAMTERITQKMKERELAS